MVGRLKILMPSEYHSGNTYVKDFVDELRSYAEVKTEVDTFWTTDEKFDIIHIQWVEELFKWIKISEADFEKLKSRILYFKNKGTSLITTLHNFSPRSTKGELGKQIYDFIYMESDIIINLEKESCHIFPTKRNEILAHPNYNKHIKYCQGLTVNQIMTFGKIRSLKELKLVVNTFRGLKSDDYSLLIPNAKNPYRKLHTAKWLRYELYTKLYVNRIKKIKMIFRKLSSSEMDDYFNKSKIVFISRFDSLNSGAVYMALSYGKVVVGPNIGNIGCLLNNLNNPIFNPFDTGSAITALKRGIILAEQNLGEKNKMYSDNVLDIKILGRELFAIYQSLLK